MTTTPVTRTPGDDPTSPAPTSPAPADQGPTIRVPASEGRGQTSGQQPGQTSGRRRHRTRRRPTRRGVLLTLLIVVAVLLVAGASADGFAARMVADRIAQRMGCPGSTPPEVQVRLGGGRVIPQLLRDRLSEIRLTVPDTAVGGAEHATVTATLTGVTRLTSDTPRAERLESSTAIGFAGMPAPKDRPRPTFGRSPDGSLTVTVPVDQGVSKNVKATLFLQLQLQGENVIATPQRLLLFGQMLQASKVTTVTGGIRRTPLPHLPTGLAYTSISAKQDGLHVGLNGVVVTPLSTLPTQVGDQTVSYSAKNGLMGITSSMIHVPPIIDESVTIWVKPQLDGNKLTMVPQSVEALGSNRPTDDPIAGIVLDQVDQKSLTRTLPVLPVGVRYKSAGVDPAGVKVSVGGETVKPYSQVPQPSDGIPTTYGTQGGLLTASTKGMPSSGSGSTITLFSHPRIAGTTLDLDPQTIQLFGIPFPADAVLSQIGPQGTTYPLDALPAGLTYSGVRVLPSGLQVLVSGRNVTLSGGLPGGKGCSPGR
jgi:hypothetical protein